ncbi:hypothetical protein CJ030_MR8G028465 [Morella rubra]|uniref:Uncharacterized protein n=1 Tax=Morella rubra TaxID=262757 RepID=A0A6A1UZ96_9ROSI|nr:hypothetical protein CJ030_MR8G028465 [Morella rubra]
MGNRSKDLLHLEHKNRSTSPLGLFLSRDNSEDHDIEVLTGNESEVIEMNLMLGVADLHTPEAVAAAESAITGSRPVVPLAASSSETDSEDSSNTDCDDDDNDSDDGKGTRSPMKLKTSKLGRDNNSKEDVSQLKKQAKIVELS